MPFLLETKTYRLRGHFEPDDQGYVDKAELASWKARDPIAALRAKLLPIVHRDRPVVLEGGAIDVNGRGTILTTEECMLDPEVQVRNPGFDRADYEAVFRDAHLSAMQGTTK